MVRIDSRSARSLRVILVSFIGFVVDLFFPDLRTIVGAVATHKTLAGCFVGAGHEDSLAPNHGRRMTRSGQLNRPAKVVCRPFGRNRLRFSDAQSVNTTKTVASCRRLPAPSTPEGTQCMRIFRTTGLLPSKIYSFMRCWKIIVLNSVCGELKNRLLIGILIHNGS